ncbi:MAG: DUF262 domain-containing protein [Bacteroidetes bacterium]|nr:DUF262 domain-containing protein [Bacteroidota bacterium]
MSYEKLTIKQVIEKIGNNELYLPAIQRKFVWKQEQTEKLFDSIQQGYPIGTFLFWFLKRPHIDSYVFYKFLQDYHQRDSYLNVRIPNPELKDEIIGILDGQQRLSSIYLALQGTYAIKKPYYSWTNNNAFPKRTLFLNLLSDVHTDEDNEFNFSFKFITKTEANEKANDKLWFKVREVLTWDKDSPPVDEFYDQLMTDNNSVPIVLAKLNESETRNRIKRIVRDLHSRLVREELINYFKIEEQELDNILKIFVRVNSGGTILSKTDLLFSTIVANWENGRDEIENFITTLNKFGDGFSFNNDFVMRNCLMLTDCDVLFKVGSFKTENVLKIKDNWENIKCAIQKTVELLVEFGLNGSTLPSQNSVMPIAYYAMKGGVFNSKTKYDLKKYLYHALLKNIFSGQGDAVLTNFRNTLRVKNTTNDDFIIKETEFKFDSIASTKLPSNKSLKITDDDINEILGYKKGTSSFLVLSFLYPNFKFEQIKFHQDHIHPQSQFTEAKMNLANISFDNQKKYLELRDTLPNLQIMEGIENIKKNKTPFKEWLNSVDDSNNLTVPDKNKFLSDNYIDQSLNLDFDNFLHFHENRKTKLKTELERLLK